MSPSPEPGADSAAPARGTRVFLCGDVMTGRGIDQILPHPAPPHLFEHWVRCATTYVELAERQSGAIGRGLDFSYPWGDAPAVLEQWRPAARLVNLETAVTSSEDAQPGKGIHYRMSPANLPCLASAGIDCCALANNHVLDWGRAGLADTLRTLRAAGIRTAGAGNDAREAAEPAVLPLAAGSRVLVFSFAAESSGVPPGWAATQSCSGVNFLDPVCARSAARIAELVDRQRQAGDLVLVSVHWGGNWGFAIPREQRDFAHALIDAGGADLVHGHSSHHVKGIEVYRGKLILYGCGDFLNDYEGIAGHEEFRPELALMYFPMLDRTGALRQLDMVPMRLRRLRLERADAEGTAWLAQLLNREGQRLGTRADADGHGALSLGW